ncbi:MAG: glycosyltransferase family 2 protein [Bacteroidales bacterium]|jgi:cellulose synthase/poly-beta-1,6-N-acetylglucosamine synthase-like glycosyltransferase
MLQFLSKAEWILFIIMAIPVGYYLVFSFFSLWGGGKKYPVAKKKSRVVVLIPAYKEDRVIEGSVRSIMAQEYPENKMDIVVISDKMRDETNEMLATLPVKLLEINPEISSKAVALNMAIDSLKGEKYDLIVILDADNVVDPNFISEINDAFYFGLTAIQAHRTAKNLNNDMAILDAISEEINNSIFRKGHVNMGFSSALIGSGMAFEYKWFKHNVKKLSTSGEDKELEIILFKDRIFVDYLDNLMVYDEKIQEERGFYNQRRRWIAAQFGSLFSALKDLPGAIFSRNIDYVERIFVWMLPPKIIIMGIIAIVSLVTLVLQWRLTFKWWALLVLMLISFAMAIPDFLITKRSLKAINRLPLIFILMFINLFRTKGVNKKFIHTSKDF